MTVAIDDTHDPALRSWVESANETGCDFPIQNLPLGVFCRKGADEEPRVGVAIGDHIVDLGACRSGGLFKGRPFTAAIACEVPSLNALMALGHDYLQALRGRVQELLRADGSATDDERRTVERSLVPMNGVDMLLPVEIGDYTDFYASVFHASNVGSMFRPDNPLLPNYKHIPIAYHGRASSITASGTPVRRPAGQTKDDDAELPVFGPSKLVDYELEVGFFIGPGNPQGEPIPIEAAEERIFGLCIVNDWSARDIQKWEYQPLGPFLSKSFATTVSPWVVTLEALAPFRVPAFERPAADPPPLAYLSSGKNTEQGGIDIMLEVHLVTEKMRAVNHEPVRLSRGNFRDMYWTIAQMVAHHASNGCNLRAGDLLASGTVSGEAKDSRGCLLELTWRGSEPIALPGGEERRFLQDGDEIIITASCEREGYARIGFGECRARLVAAAG